MPTGCEEAAKLDDLTAAIALTLTGASVTVAFLVLIVHSVGALRARVLNAGRASTLQHLLFYSLSLAGALVSGFLPGSFIAFSFAASSGGGEVLCCALNIGFGVGGALVGSLIAKLADGLTRFRPLEVAIPVAIGALVGAIGYVWADWVLSHANPPL
jgi:hypothetical protein